MYTTRASSAMLCATSCRFGEVGIPLPMSSHCLIPWERASTRVARCMKSRFSTALRKMPGKIVATSFAASRSGR